MKKMNLGILATASFSRGIVITVITSGVLVGARLCFMDSFGLLGWVGEWRYASDATEIN